MTQRKHFFLALIFLTFSCTKPVHLFKKRTTIDRSHAPSAGAAPKINLSAYKNFTLANGLQVIVVENHRVPQVSYELNLDIDPVIEGNKAGLSYLAGTLLKAGTTHRTKKEIDEEIDQLGGWISTASVGIYATSLTKHSENLLSILSDILLHPTFPEKELQKEKAIYISELVAGENDPEIVSERVSNLINYGKNHPYGEFETEKSINNITREDLVNYYQTFFRPNVGFLLIVGDITEEQARINAEKYFGKWQAREVPTFQYETPLPPATNRLVVIPIKEAVQSIINVTYPINIHPGDSGNVAANIMNALFGGNSFSSRLMQNLREDKGYTYGAYSSLIKDELIGEFSAGASVRNEVTDSALTQILFEMQTLVESPVADSSLQLIKNSTLGHIALSLEDPEVAANYALNIEKYHLPKGFYDSYLRQVEKLTPEDILAAAQKYILPNQANIIVMGNVDEIVNKLAVFTKNNEVEVLDIYGNPWLGIKKAPEGVTCQTIFNNYVKASGGRAFLDSISSYRQTGKMNASNIEMDMVLLVKNPDKMNLNVSVGTNSIMQQIINGREGIQILEGKKTAIDEKEMQTTLLHINPLSCYQLDDYGLHAKLLGVKQFEGENCYLIAVMDANDVLYTDYYSVASGLKIGSHITFDSPQGPLDIWSKYTQYKHFGNIYLPSVTKQSIGDQIIVFTIESMDANISINDDVFKLE